MMRRMVAPVLLLLSWSLSGWAAQPARAAKSAPSSLRGGLSALLSGRTIPLSRKLKSLNSTWRRFSAPGAENQGLALTAIVYGTPATVYYTQGQTISAEGEAYLIAYSPRPIGGGLIALVTGSRGLPASKVTGDSPLQLALLNLRTMGSLTDVRRFSLKAEIDGLNRISSALQRAMSAASAAASGTGQGAPGEDDESLSNLKSVAMAAQMYLADYDKAPPMDTPEAFRAALDEYVPNAEAFKDPEHDEYYAINSSLGGKAASTLKTPAQTVLAYQATAGKDGRRAVGFLDGHVQKVTEQEWQKLKAASGISP